ncbi:MAG: ADOP family duplicated permease [Bryobacteraceae bacterium]
MRPLRRFFHRLTAWTGRQESEQRLQAEIEEHLAHQTADNIRAGLSPVEARRQAVLKFGSVESIKESYHDQRGFPLIENLLRDIRYALRRLRKSPAFTVTTILTLALGIGATTCIFTLVYAVLLKSLEVANPDELYRLGKEANCCYIDSYNQEGGFSLVSYQLYKYFRDHMKGFAELAAFQAMEPQFGVRRASGSAPAQSFPGEFVSGNYFTMFGIHAYAGRLLAASDDRPSALPVAVLSYRLWVQRYGSDPSVIGSTVEIDGKPFTVVGITPPNFFGDRLRNNPPDFYLPLNTEPLVGVVGAADPLHTARVAWLDLIGRIKPGANSVALEAQMRVELKQWLRSHWGRMSANDRAKFPEQTLYLRPGGSGITSMRDQYEHWLQILMMVSGFVLLIVCANVANLMLLRGMERRRQTSLSMALGAQPLRLVRQALTESVLLSLLGGAAGLVAAYAGTNLILHFAFPHTGATAGIPISASPSMPVLLFAFGVSLVTGIIFGIGPAWMGTRVDPIEALRGVGRSTPRAGSLPRKALVVFQAALALVLLSASGLLTAVLHKLEHQNFGFDQNRRIVVNMNPMLAGYRMDQLTPLYRRIHDSLASIPGGSAVAFCNYSPLSGGAWTTGVWFDGHPPPGPRDDNSASLERVTPGYFDAIGTPIIEGRGLSEQDTSASRHVAVVNEAFARKFFKHQNPIGQHFGRIGLRSGQYEIVGIAKDARYLIGSLGKPIAPFFFLPQAQHDFPPKGETEQTPGSHFLRNIVIVTQRGASLSDAQIRKAIASVDPNLPIISIQTLKQQIAGVFTQQRLIARLTSLLGFLSLVLASIGLYGVTAYNAGCRTNEIGIRMALGANRRQVIALVLRGAFGLILVGLLIGLPLSFAAGRFLGNQLYGMSPYNSVVTLIAVAALGLSALVAAFIPALRASFISPLEALRIE